jgi:hypothetical protein
MADRNPACESGPSNDELQRTSDGNAAGSPLNSVFDGPSGMVRPIALALALVACQHSEDRHVRREVEAKELLGRWTITPFGLRSLADVGVQSHLATSDHWLVIRADQTCRIQTMFGLPGPRAIYRSYESGCRWRLGNDGHQSLQLDLSPAPPTGSPYFYFADEHGRLIIWQYATDPDAWKYVEFERAVEQ